MALMAFPMQSNFAGYDEYDNPIFDRAVDSLFYRTFWMKYFTDGIFYEPADNFLVTAIGDFKLSVKLGECHVRGITASPDDEVFEVLTLDAAEVAVDRTDRIVIRADFEGNRAVTVEVLKDWKAGDSLTRNSNAWELAVADVLVKKSSVSIQQANITDLRLDSELCGVVTEPIRRTNTQAFFEQLGAELLRVRSEWDDQKEQQGNDWQEQMIEQADKFSERVADYNEWKWQIDAWKGLIIAEFQEKVGFSFDNRISIPGTVRTLDDSEEGVIDEWIRFMIDDKPLANLRTVFNGDGSIEEALAVYNSDGETYFNRTRAVTTFAGGKPRTEVSSI